MGYEPQRRASPFGSGSRHDCCRLVQHTSFSLNIAFNDGNTHLVALYAVDYDSRGRAETIQIVDPATNNILNSQVLSNFSNGVYLLWNISGQVKINVTSSAGPNAVDQRSFLR